MSFFLLMILAGAMIVARPETCAQGAWNPLGEGPDNPIRTLASGDSLLYGLAMENRSEGAVVVWDDQSWREETSFFTEDHILLEAAEFWDGGFVVSGFFDHFNDIPGTRCIAMYKDGEWRSLGKGFENATIPLALQMTRYQNGLVVAGKLNVADDSTVVNNVAFWDGQSWSAFGEGLPEAVLIDALTEFKGDLYAAGQFRIDAEGDIRHVARWDGQSWTEVGGGVSSGEGPVGVQAMAVFNERLYIAGSFDAAGGSPAERFAVWNGAAWEAPEAGPPGDEDFVLNGMTAFGDLLVAYGYNAPGGESDSIYAYAYDGETWTPFGNKLDNPIETAAVWNDRFYIGGGFTNAAGVRFAAEWDETTALPEIGSDNAESLFVYPQPAGDFLYLPKDARIRYARLLSPDGKTAVQLRPEPGNASQLQLPELPVGLYVLELTDSSGETIRKKIMLK